MIQRLQSLYLLIVTVLCIVSLCVTIAGFTAGGDTVAEFSNFRFTALVSPFDQVVTAGPWCLAIIQMVVAALSVFTILNFNKRVLQMRITVFNIILLFGYIVLYAFYAWLYQQKLNAVEADFEATFQPRLAAIYPLVSVILCILAYKGIKRDEKLVRSLERIR